MKKLDKGFQSMFNSKLHNVCFLIFLCMWLCYVCKQGVTNRKYYIKHRPKCAFRLILAKYTLILEMWVIWIVCNKYIWINHVAIIYTPCTLLCVLYQFYCEASFLKCVKLMCVKYCKKSPAKLCLWWKWNHSILTKTICF